MKIKGTRDQFLNCLSKVSPATDRANINPILSNVLLIADTGSVDIIATDQETQIKSPCEVKANKKFNATVSAKKFHDILRRLDAEGIVSLDYNEGKDGNASINVSSGKVRYKLSTIDASEFPRLGEKDSFKDLLKIPADVFLNALKMVSYASAVNSHRMNLNGILLESSAKKLRLVATDGHRMAVQDLKCKDHSPEETQLILPRKSVNELIRNLPGEGDSEIEIKYSDRVARFYAASFELTTSLISESFPDYNSVIPRNNDKAIVVSRMELLNALYRVSAIATDRDPTIVINFEKDSTKLEHTNKDGETANDEIAAKYEGEMIEVGFNNQYLTDMLTAATDDGFQINILDSSSSVLFEPAGQKTSSFKYVVMPVRL